MAELGNTCLIHCEDSVGPLTNFTEVSFERFLECRKKWIQLDGRQKDIALRTTQIISIEEEYRYENFKELAFRRKCYSAFTNTTLLHRAEERRKKAEKEIKSPLTSVDQGSSDPIPKKVFPSSLAASTSATRSRNEHVLPPDCIVCKKKDLYYTDLVSQSFFAFISSVYCQFC